MDYLFGIGHSAFIHGGERIELPFSTIEADYSIPDEIEHKSIFNGVKHFLNNNDYSNFMVTINLFKYPDPNAYALTLESYSKKVVRFAPHNDGVIKNILGDEVGFFITDVTPFYLENLEKYAGVVVFFTATEPTAIFPLEKYLVTEDDEQILTEDGSAIFLE